jgi:AraC-like DNA-binding protein
MTIEPSCSARMLQPFMRWATTRESHRDLVPSEFWRVPSEGRVSLDRVHDMLSNGVESIKDELLGLRLGQAMTLGAGGAFDYAVRSAATFGASLSTAAKYSRLIADPFRITFENFRASAVVRLDSESSWPRPAADFAMSAIHKLHVSEHVPGARLEAWFAYATPRHLPDYQRLFPGVSLRFGAPFFGFVFPKAFAEAPLPGSDPALHALLTNRVDAMMSELSASRTLSSVIRRLVEAELPSGNPSAERIARAVHMSRRTMARRLALEGTTFDTELDAVRRRIAMSAVAGSQVQLAEIAFLAGFSHVESFYRAFRRWTDMTPLAYREANASGAFAAAAERA